MKTFIKTLICTLIIAPQIAVAQSTDHATPNQLQFTLSTGIVSSPDYLGAVDNQIVAVPNISVTYADRLSASLDGVRYTLLAEDGLRIGVVGAYHFGRQDAPDDNPLRLHGGETTDLDGLGDIDGTVEVGGFIALDHQQVSARIEVRQGVGGGHDGIYGEAELMYNAPIAAFAHPTFVSIGPAIAFGDDAYNSTFFDVSAAQSAASGLRQYDANGGLISAGLHAAAVVQLTQTKSLVGFASYDRLGNEIGDSSLVKDRGSRDQLSAGIVLNYSF